MIGPEFKLKENSGLETSVEILEKGEKVVKVKWVSEIPLVISVETSLGWSATKGQASEWTHIAIMSRVNHPLQHNFTQPYLLITLLRC